MAFNCRSFSPNPSSASSVNQITPDGSGEFASALGKIGFGQIVREAFADHHDEGAGAVFLDINEPARKSASQLGKRFYNIWVKLSAYPGVGGVMPPDDPDLPSPERNSDPTKMIKRRAYIVGCPRSGTTLLQCLLGAHSQMNTFPESHFFEDYDAAWPLNRLGFRSRKIPRKMVRFLEKIDRKDLQSCMPTGFHSLLRKPYAAGFVRLLDQLTLERGKTSWVGKTPTHLKAIPTIDALVDSIFCIHIVRDGCHTVASLYDVFTHDWHDRDFQLVPEGQRLEHCFHFWETCMRQHMRHANNPSHFFVDYDHLTQDPRQPLERLCRFLGLPFEEAMLRDYPQVAKTVVLKHEVWKNAAKEPIECKRAKFYTMFTEDERQWLERRTAMLCAELLSFLGETALTSERTGDLIRFLQRGAAEKNHVGESVAKLGGAHGASPLSSKGNSNGTTPLFSINETILRNADSASANGTESLRRVSFS